MTTAEQPTVKCRYCNGQGGNYRADFTGLYRRPGMDSEPHGPPQLGFYPCGYCNRTGRQPAPKKKLSTLLTPTHFLVACDWLEDQDVDLTVLPDLTTLEGQAEACYLVGATPIVREVCRYGKGRLGHVIIRMETQHSRGYGTLHYFRPVFRKDRVLPLLTWCLQDDVERHMVTLEKRYVKSNYRSIRNATGEIVGLEVPPVDRSRKRWKVWDRKLLKGVELA